MTVAGGFFSSRRLRSPVRATDSRAGGEENDEQIERDASSGDRSVGRRAPTRRGVLATTAGIGLAGCVGSGDDVNCPTPETVTPVESMDPTALSTGAPTVTVRAWEDLSCPHCATFATEVVPRLREEYVSEGEVRFVRHDFPIPVEDWAWPAASAVRAAQRHGGADAALTFAETVYEEQSDYERSTLVRAGDAAGINPCLAVESADTGKYRPVVERDKQRGRDRGVGGTPAVFVDGDPVEFGREIEYQTLRAAVDGAL